MKSRLPKSARGLDPDNKYLWAEWTLLQDARITRDYVLEYRYHEEMRSVLRHPAIYARLDIELGNQFKKKFSLALWEILLGQIHPKANYKKTQFVNIAVFKQLMGIAPEKYDKKYDLKRYVIKPAIEEINQLTTLQVKEEFEGQGNALRIRFEIKRKQEFDGAVDEAEMPVLEQTQSKPGVGQGSDSAYAAVISKMTNSFGMTASAANDLIDQVKTFRSADNILQVIDYVQDKQAKGQIKKSVAGYLKTVLVSQNMDIQSEQPTHPSHQTKASSGDPGTVDIGRMFAQHQQGRVEQELSGLSEDEQFKLRADFEQGLTEDEKKIYIDKGQLKGRLKGMYQNYLVNRLLSDPVDLDIETFRKSQSVLI